MTATSDLFRLVRFWLWGPAALLVTFIPLLFLHTMQLPTLLVLPFSKPLFRRLNTYLAGGVWGLWGWGLQKIDRTEIAVEGDQLPDREDAIVISNHQQMGDIVVLMALALRAHSVRHMKWLVKDVVKYVPGVGWGLMFLDSVFLKRDWARDEKNVQRVFSQIGANHLPVWLSSFPEGTRATPEKLRKSQEMSEKKGMKPLQHLLMPKTKGFSEAVMSLRHHVKAVYSVTIGYVGGVPTLMDMIRGDIRRIEVNVRRIPIETLPHEKERLGEWLIEEFRTKDSILDQMVTLRGCGTPATAES